ncbi:MAG: AIM24 family protein [Clostridium sp.]|nr:AIM24 family protein [Clostridium sp.]MCM1207638.1 AIM24 family protein [Ruminococcus sp.]
MVYQSYANNQNIVIKSELGGMQVLEYARDMSVSPHNAKVEYYSAKMNVNKRQVLLNLNGNGYTVQAGAMQWISGNVQMSTGVKGVGNFLGKMVSGAVTGESAVKPIYEGYGQVMLEPTYRHILLTDIASWGDSVVLDDGLFLACDNTVQQKVVARSNVSSAVFGGEGLFNLSLNGQGVAALESIVPMEELIEINLENDVMKIDGNMAIAWSGSLEFTVEKSGKSLLGSAVSGEGLVNVYRGTGKIWMAPVTTMIAGAGRSDSTENASTGRTGSAAANAGNKAMDRADKISSFLDKFS